MLRLSRPAAPALAAMGVLALGACAGEVTAPAKAPLHSTVAAMSASSTYIVDFKSTGVPAGFASTVASLGGTVAFSHAGAGIAVVSGLSSDAATKLSSSTGVADVQPDADVSLSQPAAAVEADVTDVIGSQTNPTLASRYPWQWNMRLINADKAWAAGKLGSSNVTVAILDTGIDYDAPDLAGLVDLTRSTSFIPSDDQITSTFFPNRNVISDYHGHGTNVASQVSSKALALAGVTSKTTLIGVKVLNGLGRGPFSAIMEGVLWAADHGADVANMSLGGGFAKAARGPLVAAINRTFAYAKQKGMLVVVAAGNDGADLDHNGNFNADYCDAPHVICVSSVGPTTWTGDGNVPAFYTNFGRSAIDVAAPGGNAQVNADGSIAVSAWPWGNDIASWVWSFCSKTRLVFDAKGNPVALTACAAGNRITGYIGTSQATPHVAGLAALLISETGRGNPAFVKASIEKSSIDLGQPGVDPFYGNGRIDVAKALGLN